MTAREMVERRSTLNSLVAQFRPLWNDDMVSDARRNALSDLDHAGWNEDDAIELVELAIDITRE